MTRPAHDQHTAVPALGGTGRLADDLYLMAHHERTGRPLLAPRAAGLGLAGALLGELILDGAISVTASAVMAAGPAPDEELTAGVLGLVAAEPGPRPTQDWLAFLARTAPTGVARRLARAGYLTPSQSWRGQRWIPADPDCAFAPVARAKSGLDRGDDVHDVTLAALAAACGLGARLALYLPSASRDCLPAAAGWLDPALREVITQTQAAVDSAVLAHRT